MIVKKPHLAQWLERSAVDSVLTVPEELYEKQTAGTERFLVQVREWGYKDGVNPIFFQKKETFINSQFFPIMEYGQRFF